MRTKRYTRRQALAAFACLGITSSCTPINALFANKKPPDQTIDITLRAFMETVIPGIPINAQGLTGIFYDVYYPFYPYKKVLAEDLNRESYKKYNSKKFYNLSLEKREQIIERKLSKNGITQKLYVGAIWLTQLTVYTGIYNLEGECSLIDFKCMDSKTISYSDATSFLGVPATNNGNPS